MTAVVIIQDSNFPATEDYTVILNYLKDNNVSSALIDAFNDVYLDFDRY
jgi:uncharacterized protein YozE (UPF0346 family)